MMQTRSMVNKPNLTVEITPYVYKSGDEVPRKRKRVVKVLDYKSIIQTRSQKLLKPVVDDVVPAQEPLVAPSGGDSNPTPDLLLVFLTVSLFITALGAFAWLYL